MEKAAEVEATARRQDDAFQGVCLRMREIIETPLLEAERIRANSSLKKGRRASKKRRHRSRRHHDSEYGDSDSDSDDSGSTDSTGSA